MLTCTVKLTRQFTAVLLLLVFSRNAYAYIDPGTGSLIIQSILAAVAGAAVVIRFYWHRILTFLGFRKDDNRETHQDNRED